MTRHEFATGYRIARLTFNGHRFAACQAMKRGTSPALARTAAIVAAFRCYRQDGGRTFGVQASRIAQREGRSFRRAIRLNLDAARYRRATGFQGWAVRLP